MRKLGTIDLEILFLAIKENGTFDENDLENSELKRYGVGKILDTLASLRDRKFISSNSDGSFSITKVAREILWSNNVPIWGKILRLLQIKAHSLKQIIEIIRMDEDKIKSEIENLRKNQMILMSPQRKDGKIIRIYEILPEGIQRIDKTDTDGFDKIKISKMEFNKETPDIINEITKEIKQLEINQVKKDIILNKIKDLKQKLGI
jgi:hypothetical protein